MAVFIKTLLLTTTICLVFILSYVYFQPVSIVVPHHNVVAEERRQFIENMSRKRLMTRHVILVSPDHFSNRQNSLNYSDRNWQLSNGLLPFDLDLARQIDLDIDKNNSILSQDHGIFNILTDIKEAFPRAKIIPIVIGQKVEVKDLNDLVDSLTRNCGFDCLLIASVDFSHYLPAKLADVHDQKSISVLSNQDIDQIFQLEVDSPQSVYISVKLSKNRRASAFQLYSHTNSGQMVGNASIETTSHVMSWYSRSPVLRGEKVTTFTLLPFEIDREVNQDSLGDRFFYGTDETYVVDNPYQISTDEDFVIAGYLKGSELNLAYFPISVKDNQVFFDRDQDRQDKIDQYFPELTKQLSNGQSNPFWATINYEY